MSPLVVIKIFAFFSKTHDDCCDCLLHHVRHVLRHVRPPQNEELKIQLEELKKHAFGLERENAGLTAELSNAEGKLDVAMSRPYVSARVRRSSLSLFPAPASAQPPLPQRQFRTAPYVSFDDRETNDRGTHDRGTHDSGKPYAR